MVFTFKYDCLFNLLSGNKELREICIDLYVQVDSALLSILTSWLCSCWNHEPGSCGFFFLFFFLNDFIHCRKENVFGSGAEVIVGNHRFACWLTGQEASSVYYCLFRDTWTKCSWQLQESHSWWIHRIIVYFINVQHLMSFTPGWL